MKQLLIVLGVLVILSLVLMQLQQYVLAVTAGVEPTKEIITAIKNCTKGQYKDKSQFSYPFRRIASSYSDNSSKRYDWYPCFEGSSSR